MECALRLYRAKRHRAPTLQLIDREVMLLKHRGFNDEDDICLWQRDNGDFKDGFSTSHTWNIIRDKSSKVSWFKGVWFSGATPRFSFLIWIAIHNRLSTGDRILRWNPQAISTCWLCKVDNETRDHLFFECDYSDKVWKGTVKSLAGRRNLSDWSRVVQVAVNGLHGKVQTFLFRYCFQAVAYALWQERNKRRVGESSQPVSCLISKLDNLIRNRITSLRRRKGNNYEKAMEIWFGLENVDSG